MNEGNPIRRLLSSSKALTALIAVVLALAAMFGIPDEHQQHITSIITGIFILAAIMIGGTAYEDGKLKEGTTPSGEPANKTEVNVVTPSAAAAESIPSISIPKDAKLSNEEFNAMKNKFPLFVLSILMIGLSGCAGTSKAFKIGAANGVPAICDGADMLIDSSDSDGATKAVRKLEVDELRNTVSTLDKITVQNVEKEWMDVEPFYRGSVAQEDRFTETDKKIWMQSADELDRLIEAEKKRTGFPFFRP